ncbi:hypothetical protein Tco_0043884 [Tanacetum coccineum]
MFPAKTTPTPSTPPPTIDAQVTPASVSDSSPTFFQRLSELEKKVEALMESTVRDVLQKTPIYLAQPFSTPAESLTKYELHKILLDKMQKIQSFQTHEKHLDLYNALINSTMLNEAITSGDVNPSKVLKRSRHDDQDPPAGSDKEKKKKRKRKDSEPSKDKEQFGSSPKGKTQSKPSSTDKSVNAKKTVHEVAIKADESREAKDDVVNDEAQLQDDASPTHNNSIWFKLGVFSV